MGYTIKDVRSFFAALLHKRAPQRKGALLVSHHLLLEALHLPKGTVIHNVRPGFYTPDAVEFIVEHPDLQPVPAGSIIPQVTCTFGQEAVSGQAYAIRFMGWA